MYTGIVETMIKEEEQVVFRRVKQTQDHTTII